MASASLSGLPHNHLDFDLPIEGFLHTGCPHHYRFAQAGESEEDFATRLAAELEQMIEREGPETIAAFIAEPVMGAGGVIVPPKTYFEKVAKVCARHDIYMISDEVICGFGRLGTPFGMQALGFKADGMSIAKALSSAYLPIAAVTVPEKMYGALVDESRKLGTFGHGFTYGGHPVAAAVALKTLEIYARDRIFEQAAAKAPHFQARLRKLGEHPLVGEARGMGMVGGIELVADKKTKRGLRSQARRRAARGRFRPGGGRDLARDRGSDTVSICPPLVITRKRDRRDVRPARTRARPHPGLGERRRADGRLMR